MGRITVASSYFWGIVNQDVIQGDGLVGPNLLSVTVGDPNTVRAVFDRAMLQDGYLLRMDNYVITKTSDPSSALAVFRVIPVSGRQDAVDLIIQDQEAVSYDFLAGVAGGNAPIRDAYGNTLVSGIAVFVGQAPATIAYTEFYAFAGFEAGMDVKTETGWDPDLDPPYLANQDPYPGQMDTSFAPHIKLDILDDNSGVNEPTVWIKVDGAYAWLLGSIQPGFTGSRTTIPGGYRYDILRNTAFPGAYTVNVDVYARDLAAIPNILSTSYWFRTIGDLQPPFLRNRDPEPDVGGVAPNASFSFDVLDDYSGILPSTLRFYVDGGLAYSGATELWYAPYDGYVGRTVVDGYDGYHVRIDHPSFEFPASARVELRIVAHDIQGNILDETYGFWIAAKLLSVAVDPYEITLALLFSDSMREDSFLDASLFRLSGGAYVRKAELVAPDLARLWVEKLNGEGPFALSVSDEVRDIHDGYLQGAGGVVAVFQSDAMFSNTDGLVRSWHESRFVIRDIQRVYLGGTKGIDVLDARLGIQGASRWAQILDEYGVNALCLVDSADAYDFPVGGTPRVFDQQPAPGQINVPADASILFSVGDTVTTVETTSVAVYINGALVFSGASGGWANGWGGRITVHPRSLRVELFPPEPMPAGSAVQVRVLAGNLFGVQSSTTYTFTIAT